MSLVTVHGDGKTSLFDLLGGRIQGATCGGNGLCGKCAIRLVSTPPEPSGVDLRFLSSAEIERGVRIACRYYPVGDCMVEDPKLSETCDARIVRSYNIPSFRASCFRAEPGIPSKRYGIAVDIGTTTIAMELVSLDDGQVHAGTSLLNSQRRFGADVLSRIQASINGKGTELRSDVVSDVRSGVVSLLSSSKVCAADIALLTIAANTTMIHLLLNLSCAGLGTAPFTPFATSFPESSFGKIFGTEVLSSSLPARSGSSTDQLGSLANCPVQIVSCISSFVGGDIVAGLAALELSGVEGPELFIDLGTNAEMVVVNKGSYWCASASAGPAFEGGSISCGMGSVPGAVSAVYIEGNYFGWELIGAEGQAADIAVPLGVCGSGLLDFVACALEAGLVRKDGSLSPVCAETGIFLDRAGRIRLLSSDIREFQLAKAAIRAGLSVLLGAAGIREESVSRIYIAGGFGIFLKESSALAVGLLPRAFAGKIIPAGNTSLAGAVRFLSDASMGSRFSAILKKSVSVSLADNPDFESLFIASMEFGE